MRRSLVVAVLFVVGASATARAALTDGGTFNPSGAGTLCGLGLDPATQDPWVYGCSAADVQHYSATGTLLPGVTRPGESADDVDVELTPQSLTLAGTPVPAGALLFINGESGVADIYAVDKVTGAIIATLNTAFGVSHVVGGAYHPARSSFFLVQDQVPVTAEENRIAEIDRSTGAILNSFQITATFAVNFGDLEVCTTSGNLLVVSSLQTSVAEFTPAGSFVQYHALPAGVTSLSGIGIDDATGDIWVSNTTGNVWRLTGGPCAPVVAVPTLSAFAYASLALILLGAGLASLAWRRRVEG